MAMYRNLKGTTEQKMFTEWWKFFQEYYEPVTDEDFQILVVKAKEIVEPYVGTPYEKLIRSMVMAQLEYCEDRYKKNGNK